MAGAGSAPFLWLLCACCHAGDKAGCCLDCFALTLTAQSLSPEREQDTEETPQGQVTSLSLPFALKHLRVPPST